MNPYALPQMIRPTLLRLELSGKCDLSCKRCPFRNFHQYGHFMDKNLFLDIISSMWQMVPGAAIELHIGGEPMLHPDFDYIMEKAFKIKGKGLFRLSTNGQHLSTLRAYRMVETRLWDKLVFSLDAQSQKNYEKIRKGGILEKIREGILDLIDARQKFGQKKPELTLQYVVQDENADEAKDFLDFWQGEFKKRGLELALDFDFFPSALGDHICFVPCLCVEKDEQLHMNKLFEKVKNSLIPYQSDKLPPRQSIVKARNIDEIYYPCSMPWNMLSITSSGEVVPCCTGDFAGKFSMGNIKKKNIRDIWFGKKYQSLRKRHLIEKKSGFWPCSSCYSRVLSFIPPERIEAFFESSGTLTENSHFIPRKKGITAVIAAKEEGENIHSVLESMKELVDEIIVVDSGSCDGTDEIAKKHGARFYICPKEGKGAALKYGLERAIYDITVFIDADNSHNPEDIPKLIKPIRQNKADIVIASRLLGGSGEMAGSWERIIRLGGGAFITQMINTRFNKALTDSQNGFRAGKTNIFIKLDLQADDTTIEQEMIMSALRKNIRISEIASFERARRHGISKINLFEAFFPYIFSLLRGLIK